MYYFILKGTLINEYYLGCYADYYYKWDIKARYISYTGMTIEYCIGFCLNYGYKVAGLQNRF